MTNEELLNENGWEIECQSPFEIRNEDGSFATMNAAYIVLSYLRSEIENVTEDDELNDPLLVSPIEWWESLSYDEQEDIERDFGYHGHDIGTNVSDITYFYNSLFKKE